VTRRSPVRVETRKLLFGLKSRQWVCDDRLQSAQFQHRSDPDQMVIVHRSTKARDRWQTSYFDARGAVSDRQSPTCLLALKDLSPKTWRLRDVALKR
jgi:hypothetical protein